MSEKALGADATAVDTAGSIAPDAAPHVAHTPGPWKVFMGSRSIYGGPATKSKPDGVSVCVLSSPHVFPRPAVVVANAHLIAAAPDLLNVVRLFLADELALAASGDCGNYDPENLLVAKAARAAIAKAEGKP